MSSTQPAVAVTVLGATGKVGSLVVREALRRGFAVTVFVRDPARLAPDLAATAGLTVVRGEVDDPVAVAGAVAGSAAVISTVGVRYRGRHPWSGIEGRADVAPAAVRSVIDALAVSGDVGVPVVLLSAFGAGDSWRSLPAVVRAVIWTSALRTSYRALGEAEDLLRSSGRPHTVVRAVTLTDAAGTGGRVDVAPESLRGNPKVAREDVARLLLDVALPPREQAGSVLVAAAVS